MNKGLIKLSLWILLLLFLILFVITGGMTFWIYQLVQEIPDDQVIRYFSHDAVTHIYDKEGHPLISLREDQNQIWVPLSGISRALQNAVVASEDPYFFRHSGIDYRQTWESVKDNLRLWRLVRGGSTITQQVAKNLFLSSEKTFSRKIKEYFIAKRMEALLPKERILEMYLNEVGWGYGFYGAELASRFYLDKSAGELNIAEGAFLAAMLRNPAYYNPHKKLDILLKRQQLVLTLMLRHKLVTKDEYDEALSYPIVLRWNKTKQRFTHLGLDRHGDENEVLPCYVRLIERYLLQNFGRNLLYDVGLEVRTTLDSKVQNKFEEVIREVEHEKDDENPPPSMGGGEGEGKIVEGKIGEGKIVEGEQGFSGENRIGFLVEYGDRVRAIGCTRMWEDAVERAKRLGLPFDSYRYEVKREKDIRWEDILLIDAGNKLL